MNREVTTIRPRVKCEDGYSLSIQAGPACYSMPDEYAEEYSAVEVGLPLEEDPLLEPFATQGYPDVYAFVPIDICEQLIEKHGGIVDE